MTKKATVHGMATFQKYETEPWMASKVVKFWRGHRVSWGTPRLNYVDEETRRGVG